VSDSDPQFSPAPDLRLVSPALAVWLGCLLVRERSLGFAVFTAVALAMLVVIRVAGILPRKNPTALGVIAASLLMLLAGAGVTAMRADARTSGPLPVLAARGSTVRLDAVLTGDPRVRVAPGPVRARDLLIVPVRVEHLTTANQSYRLRADVLVLGRPSGWTQLLPSTRVRVYARLGPPQPGDDIAAVANVRGPPEIRAPPSTLQRLAGRLRGGLRKASSPLPEKERGLLPGLVDGDVSGLPSQVLDDFRAAGLTHLVAVSGSNCAILLGAVLVMLGRTRLRIPARAVVLLATVGLFVLIARPSPSVLRAAAMAMVAVLALLTGRPRSVVPALAAAVTALLLINPDLSVDLGFALSVLATAGLVFLAPGWRQQLASRLPGPLADAVAVAAAAQVACMPLLAGAFGSVGLMAVPANLLAVPAVAPATLLGVLVTVLAQVWLPAAQLVARLPGVCCWWLVTVARRAAGMPSAVVAWPAGVVGAAAAVAVTVVLVAALRRRGGRRMLAVAACAALLTRLAAGPVLTSAWPPTGWRLLMCDVGQGDAFLISTGRGDPVLVDAGPDPAPLRTCLQQAGVHGLERIVLTHMHADHVDGLPAVLGRLPVREVEIGPLAEPPANWQWVRQRIAAAHVPIRMAQIGAVETVGDLSWTVLAPRVVLHGTDSDPNNDSLVLSVRTPTMTLLMTGDVETEGEQDLLRQPGALHADVLKVPHHGSDRQDPRFVAEVQATVALTSVGTGNPYGHPGPQTMQRLQDNGVRSFRSDRDGSVAVARDARGRLVALRHRGPSGGQGRTTPSAAIDVPLRKERE
jgi:competence protein ComEC